MHQLGWGHASVLKCQEGKDFSFLIHCDSALWCIVKKKSDKIGMKWNYLAIMEWGWVGYEELCRLRWIIPSEICVILHIVLKPRNPRACALPICGNVVDCTSRSFHSFLTKCYWCKFGHHKENFIYESKCCRIKFDIWCPLSCCEIWPFP